MNTITFKTNLYKELILSVEELCRTWHEERKYVKTFGISFNPDREYFNLLYRSGNLVDVYILDGDKLVGCYLGCKSKSMHDTNIKQCQVMLWCIAKEYRSSDLLIKFLAFIDAEMKRHTVDLYSLCLDDSPEYEKTGKYLCSEINPTPFTKIESYFHRDMRTGNGNHT